MGWIRVSNRYRVLVTPLLFEHIWLRNVVTAEAMRSFWSQTRQPVDARCRNPEATLRRDCVLGLHLDLGPPETRFDFVHILPNLEVLHWPDGWDPLRSSILGAPKNSSGVHFSKLRYIANINAASVEAEGYSVEEAFPADLARIIARCPNLETLSFADPELEWLALERRVIIDAIRVHTMTASFFRHDIEPGSSGGGLTRLEFVKRCRLPDRGLLEGIGAAAPNLRELVLDVGADAIGWDLTNLMAAFPKLEKLSLQSLCAARGVTGNLDLVLQVRAVVVALPLLAQDSSTELPPPALSRPLRLAADEPLLLPARQLVIPPVVDRPPAGRAPQLLPRARPPPPLGRADHEDGQDCDGHGGRGHRLGQPAVAHQARALTRPLLRLHPVPERLARSRSWRIPPCLPPSLLSLSSAPFWPDPHGCSGQQ